MRRAQSLGKARLGKSIILMRGWAFGEASLALRVGICWRTVEDFAPDVRLD
jgi:hypothetical protein